MQKLKKLSAFQMQLRGTLLVAVSGGLYGFIGYFGTHLLNQHLSVATMLFWRFFIAALWMMLIFSLSRKKIMKHHYSQLTVLKTILIGALCYSSASALYFLASTRTGTGIAMVIFFCYPVLVTLMTWIFSNWQINRIAACSLFAIIFGLILLKGHGSHTIDSLGIFFAILSGLSYAIYIVTCKHRTEKIDSGLLTFLICLGNAIIFLIISCATHSFAFPTHMGWFYVSAIGIIATALPIQLLLDGMKYINPIKASILSVLEPVVTLGVGALLLHESMSYTQSIGVIVVLLGALLIQFERQSA